MSIPAIAVKNLVKTFGGSTVLQGIDLDIVQGQVSCVIGPSGSGKSTLLRCMWKLSAMPARSLQRPGSKEARRLKSGAATKAKKPRPVNAEVMSRSLLRRFDEAVAFVEELQHGFTAFEIGPVGGEFDAIAGAGHGDQPGSDASQVYESSTFSLMQPGRRG